MFLKQKQIAMDTSTGEQLSRLLLTSMGIWSKEYVIMSNISQLNHILETDLTENGFHL